VTLPNYRFIGLTPRFYPDERGADGRSLMAVPGLVRDWGHTPDDGLWVLEEGAEEAPPRAVPAPEPAPEPVQPEPEPVPVPVAPEPAPAPVEQAPAPVREPVPFIFPGFTAPPARA
jgi:hypothetical protein